MSIWKKIATGMTVASLASTMAACSLGGLLPAKDSGTGTTSVEITFANWISAEDATKEVYSELIADFEQKHPNIKVKPFGVPFNRFKNEVLANSTGGNPPDVIIANQNFSAAFVGSKMAEPLEGLLGPDIINDIVDRSKAGVTYAGKVMAMPLSPHPYALFWNKTLFKKAGLDPEKPPKTWDEMIAMAKQIAALGKDDKGNSIYGIGESSATDLFTGNMLLRTALSYGANFVDDKGNVVYDQGTGLKDSLAYMKDMINNRVSPKGADAKDLRGMFANGTLGMVVDDEFGRTVFRTTSGKGASFDREWGVTLMPIGKTGRSETVFTEHQLIISHESKHKEAAAGFVKYLVSKDAMLIYHQTNGMMSARKSIATLPEMNEDDYAKVFNEQMKTASLLPAANPKFENAMKESADMIVLITDGGKSPEETIATVMPKIKEMYK
ncbi:ABC transporter substrate-binding protein [Paenibacillus filicis]|uniref:ABC transporter substrate-binding protein n=1 Tax=Paenibacillus gyeongsangnamensis TaxID=3388067 RepID=A0ABT4QA10_9BACL|nr:ABC transporter substrate-binding protein [Paenibacillus filicis]MCZ8513713.1 ABC transporter substrate-binding protein [Paenibacillus filicis]